MNYVKLARRQLEDKLVLVWNYSGVLNFKKHLLEDPDAANLVDCLELFDPDFDFDQLRLDFINHWYQHRSH
jgi:hypothetical protein